MEASWVLEESQMKEGLGTEELFRGLVPLTQDVRQVFRAKVVKKQIDRKWKSSLALKPSMDLFADEVCGRQVRSFSLPALPLPVATPASINVSCGPLLIASYTRHLDFQWNDLRELPDSVLDVDTLC